MLFRENLAKMWNNVQYKLFPDLEERISLLSNKHKRLIAVLELARIEEFIPTYRFVLGRPSKTRAFIARAYIAKSILKLSTTSQLIEYLKVDKQLRMICGGGTDCKIPSKSTFSRAFNEFAKSSLPEKVHQSLISSLYKDKTICHLIKDSTPIVSREKALIKEGSWKDRQKLSKAQYKREKKGVLSRKQKQLMQDLSTMTKELPTSCDTGAKKGSAGFRLVWKGYKLHAAVDDNCVPISIILTSASVGDSEVAIPLAEKSNRLVKNIYDLMDGAYDYPEIKEHSISLGHIPLIDKAPRTKAAKAEKMLEKKARKTLGLYYAEDRRYRERFSRERFNALFKDNYGGKSIFYRGHTKVFCHLMFGILALTASMFLPSF